MSGVGFVIEELWAFIAVVSDGDEGVVGIPTPTGMGPAVAADRDRLESIRPIVEKFAAQSETPVKLVKFHQRTDVETLKGPND
jgi:hypothetical protein